MRITMIGHSTVLIEAAGKKLLTDPYFGAWGNPAYARVAPPAQPRAALRDVDLVLISHSHWDHTDRAFLRALPVETPVLVPARARLPMTLVGVRRPLGLAVWEEHRVGPFTVTAVPALHVVVTSGFVLQAEGQTVYFAGDTFYRPFMREIGQRFRLDVALLPVTTYRIPMTMGEREAVHAVQDLQPTVVIPIHLGVRPRSPLLRTDHSPAGFARRAREAGLTTSVVILNNGESYMVDSRQ